LRHLPWRECVYAVGVLTLLLALYVGAYYATVEPFDYSAFISSRHPPPRGTPIPIYSFGGESAKTFFAPMHQVDRMLRPDVWE
jgi:hypothetical protein